MYMTGTFIVQPSTVHWNLMLFSEMMGHFVKVVVHFEGKSEVLVMCQPLVGRQLTNSWPTCVSCS